MPDNPIKLLTNMLETVERRETEKESERICGPKSHLTNNFIDTHESRREQKQRTPTCHTQLSSWHRIHSLTH